MRPIAIDGKPQEVHDRVHDRHVPTWNGDGRVGVSSQIGTRGFSVTPRGRSSAFLPQIGVEQSAAVAAAVGGAAESAVAAEAGGAATVVPAPAAIAAVEAPVGEHKVGEDLEEEEMRRRKRKVHDEIEELMEENAIKEFDLDSRKGSDFDEDAIDELSEVVLCFLLSFFHDIGGFSC